MLLPNAAIVAVMVVVSVLSWLWWPSGGWLAVMAVFGRVEGVVYGLERGFFVRSKPSRRPYAEGRGWALGRVRDCCRRAALPGRRVRWLPQGVSQW